jgi:DUF4097 and DUF4098 domain-containing protein YvlB
MRYRKIFTALVFGALLVVCSLCTLTTWAMFSGASGNGVTIRPFQFSTHSAEVKETFEFDAANRFEIFSDAGDITLVAGDSKQIQVEVVRTAWGSSAAEAQANAANLPLSVEEGVTAVTLTFDKPETLDFFNFGATGSDHIDFVVRLPADTVIDLRTGFGDIEADDVQAEARLRTSFGDIVARNIEAGDAELVLDTSFGDIVFEGGSAGDARIETSNGQVQIRDLSATGDVRIDNSFGDITLRNLDAWTVRIDNSNGEISYEVGSVTDSLEVYNSFGQIELDGVAASSYTLDTSNGDVVLSNGQGTMHLRSSFGDIRVLRAEDAVLNLETSNGDVIFSGSLDPSSDHRVTTSFGSIVISIPEDSSFDLNLDTSFGGIDSDMPVSISGALSETSWEGRINDGGNELRADTSNGDISLRIYFPQN